MGILFLDMQEAGFRFCKASHQRSIAESRQFQASVSLVVLSDLNGKLIVWNLKAWKGQTCANIQHNSIGGIKVDRVHGSVKFHKLPLLFLLFRVVHIWYLAWNVADLCSWCHVLDDGHDFEIMQSNGRILEYTLSFNTNSKRGKSAGQRLVRFSKIAFSMRK